MKTLTKYILSLAIACLIFLSNGALAQVPPHQEIIFKAMEDEMERSMNELSYEDYKKPFYIEYATNLGTAGIVGAKLGGVTEKGTFPINFPTVRLMVGDYELNDEKFNNKESRVFHNDGNSPLSIEPDYDMLRRSLWIMTNNVYKTASEKFENQLDIMEQNNYTKADMIATDFAKAEPLQMIVEEPIQEFDLNYCEKIVSDLSSKATEFQFLSDFSASISYITMHRFYVNSEGSKTLMPYALARLIVRAEAMDEKNKVVGQELKYYFDRQSDLPTLEILGQDAEALISNVKENLGAEEFSGRYEGPLIFEKGAVAQLLVEKLCTRGNGLISNPRNLVYSSKEGLFWGKLFSWDKNIGDKFLDKSISVVSYPFLEEFEGKRLIGGGEKFDLQAVVPQDSLVLFENGYLRNQLNDRTPTENQPRSFGRSQPYLSNFGSSNGYLRLSLVQKRGPDVIEVSSSEKKSMEALYATAKELADEEGNEVLYVARSLSTSADSAPINFYVVDVESGSEELIKGVNYESNSTSLKDLACVSMESSAYNMLLVDDKLLRDVMKRYERAPDEIKEFFRSMNTTGGFPMSVISPNVVLLEDQELKASGTDNIPQVVPVPSPLSVR
ncbi:MAG: hypothetical protein AAF616_07920 [Bacteroidota bacterium]